jgi:hypothetical protein
MYSVIASSVATKHAIGAMLGCFPRLKAGVAMTVAH